MSLIQSSFRVKHECPYRTVSANFPEITIREWFMNEHQILEISAPIAPDEPVIAAIATLGPRLYEASDDEQLYVVIRSDHCSIDDSLITTFDEHHCLYLPPTVYRNGWEHYTVTAFDDRDVRSLLNSLEQNRDIEVLSTTPTETRRVPHTLFTSFDVLFGGMTARQLGALRIALDNDYFSQPRGKSIEELADQTDVSRSTFEEHLRKGVNKLVSNTENHVRLLTELDDMTIRPAGHHPPVVKSG